MVTPSGSPTALSPDRELAHAVLDFLASWCGEDLPAFPHAMPPAEQHQRLGSLARLLRTRINPPEAAPLAETLAPLITDLTQAVEATGSQETHDGALPILERIKDLCLPSAERRTAQ